MRRRLEYALEGLRTWLGQSADQLDVSETADGLRVVRAKNLEARILPCRFVTCVALSEWGFQNEEARLDARKKWQDRFAELKK